MERWAKASPDAPASSLGSCATGPTATMGRGSGRKAFLGNGPRSG